MDIPDLAKRDKFQFQWWAVTLINAVPYGGKKKGADTGLMATTIASRTVKKRKPEIVSVKTGENIGVKDVRDLRGVIERERAPFAVLITLREPTRTPPSRPRGSLHNHVSARGSGGGRI